MRQSSDMLAADGSIAEGFDYQLQVWVRAGVVLGCGHPERMGPECCNARRYEGQRVTDVPGHERRG